MCVLQCYLDLSLAIESLSSRSRIFHYSRCKKFRPLLGVRYITIIRIPAHKLYLERGHHSGIARDNRLFKCCSRKDIKDKYHFILVCPTKTKTYQKFWFFKSSVFKLVKLLSRIMYIREIFTAGNNAQK